jgi:ceramide glucosyltransferase
MLHFQTGCGWVGASLALASAISFGLTLWRWGASLRFPRHDDPPFNGPFPPCTLLKPLKGTDANTRRCLRSWFAQNYPGKIQILFGVADASDPVCALVRDLSAEFPQVEAQLVVCARTRAVNGKVSTLVQLEPLIRHEWVVLSDADVCAPADCLQHLMAVVTHPDVAMANCFYRLIEPTTIAGQWELVAINSDFWTEVMQARSMGDTQFALGAVMALSRAKLHAIGGLAPLGDYLADDYQLGRRISQHGGRIAFPDRVVDCYEPPRGWKAAWSHQLRWARTVRACRPVAAFLRILSNATLWPLMWALTCPKAIPIASVFILARIITALDQQRRFMQIPWPVARTWMIPAKDLLDTAVWAHSFLGNTIEWRGEHFRIQRGGTLVPIGNKKEPQ